MQDRPEANLRKTPVKFHLMHWIYHHSVSRRDLNYVGISYLQKPLLKYLTSEASCYTAMAMAKNNYLAMHILIDEEKQGNTKLQNHGENVCEIFASSNPSTIETSAPRFLI